MIVKNIAYAALQAGYSVMFRTAPEILADLHCDSPQALRRKLSYYAQPALLAVDEVGYLSYDQPPPICSTRSSTAVTSAARL
jgi:DNA replication protein DnaC